MNDKHKNVITTVIIATFGACLLYAIKKYRKTIIRKIQNVNNPLRNQQIEIVNNFEQCHSVVDKLKIDCKDYNVIGFDCEWLTVGGSRRPVALIQLATHKGLCALIRLCHLKRIPPELREILEDNNIIKVGVAPHDDAAYLAKDYGVCVASTLDLRYVAQLTGFKHGGLANLSSSLLNVQLDKDWRIRCSDWEALTLNDRQIVYAAKDAHVAIELFKKMETSYSNVNRVWLTRKSDLPKILRDCNVYLDAKFKTPASNPVKEARKNARQFSSSSKQYMFGIPTRAKPLYDNCYLEAPDGDMLCTCDRRKAQWYVDKSLGVVVKDEPFTVRLNFEPSGRAVGEVGQYYLQEKVNQCVVCGKTDSYIRKNVVPREYRKFFPEVMKNHSSHDIVLLCIQCHQTSNMSDLRVRYTLEILCNAPIKDNQLKDIEIPNMKKIHSAARALLNSKDNIPENRKEELRDVIRQIYPNDELSETFFNYLLDLPHSEKLENYVSHGEKVVEHFNNKNGGLVEFEKMWRKHFLQTMKPQFLPPLWSVTHNSDRLEIRAEEGRIELEDMLSAGLDPALLKSKLDKSNSENNNVSQDTTITTHDSMADDEISTNDENFNRNALSLDTTITLSNSILSLEHEYDSDDLDSLLSQPRSLSGNLSDEFEEGMN